MTDQPLRKSMNVHDLVNRLHVGLICRGVYRYSYMSLRASEQAKPLLEFMEKYTALLKTA